MRLRNVPGSRDRIGESPYCIQKPEEFRGRWAEAFGQRAPLEVEIGMGKGRFLMDLAASRPGTNFLGIEKYSSVLVRGLDKLEEEQLDNVRFLRFEAENLTDIFAPGEVDCIYLNFSDPWPKDRHAKRRLTSGKFLERYEQVLSENGCIIQKTDNTDLFDFSVESVNEAGWIIDAISRDLHHSEYAEGNIMTEYEEKFSSKGHPICYMKAHPKR